MLYEDDLHAIIREQAVELNKLFKYQLHMRQEEKKKDLVKELKAKNEELSNELEAAKQEIERLNKEIDRVLVRGY